MLHSPWPLERHTGLFIARKEKFKHRVREGLTPKSEACEKILVPEQGGEQAPVPLPVRPVKPTGYEMLGVFLREVAALILVFAPLDKLIADGVIPSSWWCATVLSSSLLFLVGVALEQLNE
jgi:hypothetical protein